MVMGARAAATALEEFLVKLRDLQRR